MEVSYFYLALAVGLTISLLTEEFFGISAGGMIVPGYLAMVCDDLTQIALIFTVSLMVYLILEEVLPKYIILFGKRKFVAMLLTGMIIKLFLELCFPLLPFSTLEFRGIGIIVPGLIANCYAKQGFQYTVPAVLGASYLTFAIVSVICFVI